MNETFCHSIFCNESCFYDKKYLTESGCFTTVFSDKKLKKLTLFRYNPIHN